MPEYWKDFFTYSKSERRGIVVLVILILLVSASRWLMIWINPVEHAEIKWGPPEVYFVEEQLELDSTTDFRAEQRRESELFQFNPNTLDATGWQKLGFSPKQANAILNYREAGATFEKRADLKKLFVVDEARYEELYEFIDLPLVAASTRKVQPLAEKEVTFPTDPIIFELNTVDTVGLQSLQGIGSYYARKIVEYREQIGGYREIDQLLEIWKMKEETIEAIRPFLSLDSTQIQRIKINEIEYDSLKRHPYLSYSVARSLIAVREKHGPYAGADDLKKSALITDSLVHLITPYFSFE